MKLPLSWLKDYVEWNVTPEEFVERMMWRGFEVADILERLIDKGLGIELNTNRGANPLPDEPWLRLYRDLGGEIITMGSDAHTPEFIGCAMEECQELLRACSFRCFTTFEAQQPIFHKL